MSPLPVGHCYFFVPSWSGPVTEGIQKEEPNTVLSRTLKSKKVSGRSPAEKPSLVCVYSLWPKVFSLFEGINYQKRQEFQRPEPGISGLEKTTPSGELEFSS